MLILRSRYWASLVGLTLCLWACQVGASSVAQRQHVLILHSYHPGLEWTQGVHAGIEQSFAQDDLTVELDDEYLDIARVGSRQDRAAIINNFSTYLANKIKQRDYELIIVSDNDALNLVVDKRGMLASDIPIIFCGINFFNPSMLKGQKNITGVAETPSFDETIDLALQLSPGIRHAIFLSEETPTGNLNRALMEAQTVHLQGRIQIHVLLETDIAVIERELSALPQDWMVIPCNRPSDAKGVLPVPQARSRMARAASAAPLYANWDFWLGDGVVGGKVVSANAQGLAAGALALRVLKGESADSIPVQEASPNTFVVDHNAMERFGYSEASLPQGTVILNRPPSFYEQNQRLVWIYGSVMVVLTTITGSSILVASQRRRAAAVLKRQGEFLATLLQAVPTPVFYKGVDGRYLGCNKAFEAFLGRPRESIIGMTVHEIFSAEHAAMFSSKDRDLLLVNGTQVYELQMAVPQGTRDLVVNKTYFIGPDGLPAGIIGCITDLTEHKQTQAKLIQSEARFRNLFEEMTNGFALHEILRDENGSPADYRFLEVNPAFEKIIGITRDRLVGKTVLEVLPGTEPRWIETYGKVATTGIPVEFEDYSQELNRWFEVKAYAPSPGQFAVIIKDTTVRAQALRKLSESEEKFRQLAEQSPVSIMAFDAEGTITFASRWHLEHFAQGILAEDYFLGLKVWEIPSIASAGLAEQVRGILSGDAVRLNEVHVPNNCVGIETYQNIRGVPFRRGEMIVGGVLIREDVTERRQARETLRINEERLRLAMEATSDGLWDWDLRTGDVYWSPRAYTMLGYAPNEFRVDYDAWKSLLHPEDMGRAVLDIDRQVAETGSFQCEFRLRCKNGDWRWVIGRGMAAERGGRGQLLRMVGTHVDITERKLAEEARELNRLRFESLYRLSQTEVASEEDFRMFALEEAVKLTKSQSGYFHETRDQGQTIFLSTWSSRVRENCEISSGLHYPLEKAGIWADCIRKHAPVVHNDYQNEPGKKGYPKGHFPVLRHLSVPLIPENEVLAVLGVGNKEGEYDELDILQLQLFLEGIWTIMQRKKSRDELVVARDTAEAASKAKSEFLAIMSHEIRTPLNGIMGMLQLVRETDLNVEQTEFVETAMLSSRHLNQILSDVLDLSSIEAGRMYLRREPFKLSSVIEAVIGAFNEPAKRKGLALISSIAPDIPGLLLGDAGRLRQVLFNLVGNSLKYTEHGEIGVDAYVLPISPEGPQINLHLAIRDTGIGIPDNKLLNIFEPFTQIEDPYTRKQGGTGLGLTIVKRLVESMKGRITICSEPGRGTEMRITIPMGFLQGENNAPSSDLPAPKMSPAGTLRILVVEDERINRLAVRRLLEKEGHSVIEAGNGEEALSFLSENNVNLILMDVQMPGMSGLETTQQIRANSKRGSASHIPVIALTAHTMEGDRERCLAAGMDDYLAKPIDMAELRRMLARYQARIGLNDQWPSS